MQYCCEGQDRLPAYNPIEQRVLLYEVLGFLTSYAYYLSFLGEYEETEKEMCNQVLGSIINLINNHSQFPYAPYDQHVGIISMLYRLLDRLGRIEDIKTLIQYQCTHLAHFYRMYKKYPTAADSFEDAINIHMGFPAEDYITSAFWGTMLQWMVLLEQEELYQHLYPFLSEDLADVTKCLWFLRAEEETKFYDAYFMDLAGEGVALDMEPEFEKMKEHITFIMKQYEGEKFSFEEYSFEALEFIVCRYFNGLVRVKRK